MDFYADCFSCNFMLLVYEALSGFDQTVFEALASGVTTIGASVTTLALVIALAFRSQFGLEQSMTPQVANEVFGTITRLAIAVGFLASFTFWKTYVVGIIDGGISAIIAVAMTAISDDVLLDFDASKNPELVYAMQALYATEIGIFDPLDKTLKQVKVSFSLSPSSIGNGLLIYLGVSIIMILAVVDLAIVLLFYAEFMFWRFMITAFGPIIIFAWVFPATRPAAWSALKLLIQSGVTLILTTGVVAILARAFSYIAEIGPVKTDGTDVETLSTFFSFSGFGISVAACIVGIGLLLFCKLIALMIVFGSVPNQAGRAAAGVVGKMMGR